MRSLPERSLAVICDMDGLLVDSEPLYKDAWQGAAGRLGFDLTDDAYTRLIGRNEADCEALLRQRFGAEFPLPEFRAGWRRAWDERVEAGELHPKPGARELLSTLRGRDVRLAVATSSSTRFAGLSLRCTNLSEYFECVVASEDAARGKPAPDLYEAAAERLGIPASACLVLEDSPAGAEAGFNAGMRVIVVPDLEPPTAAGRARALGVFDSLRDATSTILAAVAGDGGTSP